MNRNQKRAELITSYAVTLFAVATLIMIGLVSCAVIDAAIKASGG